MPPSKKIYDGADLAHFRRSQGYRKLHEVLRVVTESIKGCDVPSGVLNPEIVTRSLASTTTTNRPNGPPTSPSGATSPSKSIQRILDIINTLGSLVDQTPPLPGPRRFGNLACRQWHEKVEKHAGELLEGLHPDLSYYFLQSFGSLVRLDYGTGHELSFLAFIGGLYDEGLITQETSGGDVLTLFASYYDLVRKLILTYNLEPAGSHGVWGLDDHFHLIYILGAAQFCGSKYVPQVSTILASQTIHTYKLTNLYVNGIAFIYKIKSGPFNEHSPILYDIHVTVSLWAKVLQGLLKMYEVEVFGKFPVVQHFWFGEMYAWRDESGRELPVTRKEETDDGFINGKGVHTTRQNVSMTAAPWARR